MTSIKTVTRWMGAGMAGLVMVVAVQAGNHGHAEASGDIV